MENIILSKLPVLEFFFLNSHSKKLRVPENKSTSFSNSRNKNVSLRILSFFLRTVPANNLHTALHYPINFFIAVFSPLNNETSQLADFFKDINFFLEL